MKKDFKMMTNKQINDDLMINRNHIEIINKKKKRMNQKKEAKENF